MPDEETQLVAEIVERCGLVDGRSDDADQVETGVAQLDERASKLGLRHGSPHHSAGEDVNAVHLQSEAVRFEVGGPAELAKPDGAHELSGAGAELHPVEVGLTVGVGPPPFDAADTNIATTCGE